MRKLPLVCVLGASCLGVASEAEGFDPSRKRYIKSQLIGYSGLVTHVN